MERELSADTLAGAASVIAFARFRSEALDEHADVVFPAEVYAEKEGTVTHPDGRIQRVRQALGRANEVRPGWQVLAELCERCGAGVDVSSAAQVSTRMAEAVPFYSGLTLEEIGGEGVRWQDRDAASALPAGGAFQRAARRSAAGPRGHAARWPCRASGAGPEVEHSPSLAFLAPAAQGESRGLAAARAELSPADARRLGISHGDEIELCVGGTRASATAALRTGVPEGSVFVTGAELPDGPVELGRPGTSGGRVTVESTLVLIVKSIVIFAVFLQIVPIVLLAERKLLGRFQSRIGPNRVGWRGVMQPLADVGKLLSKEQFTPATAIPWMMAIAPVISVVTAVATMAVIPFGPFDAWGGDFGLYGIDVSIGVLYFLAFGSLAFYGLMLGGWASGSKYSFLGAMRAAAQLISYEVALGLSLLGVVMTTGSMSLVDIVEHQDGIWFVIPQFVGFCIFMVAGFAETARAPFDLPEGDAEIVGGYNTEFGGMRFGSFFMAEYMEVLIISAIAATCFLGGWRGPGPEALAPLWMLLKILAGAFFFIWVRASLPRLRYDQLMSFGWKVLLPLATLNVLVTAIVLVAW